MKPSPLLVGVTALAAPAAAFAYIDPGSGMLIWQGLIAVVGAAIVFMRNPVQAFKRLIGRFKKDK